MMCACGTTPGRYVGAQRPLANHGSIRIQRARDEWNGNIHGTRGVL